LSLSRATVGLCINASWRGFGPRFLCTASATPAAPPRASAGSPFELDNLGSLRLSLAFALSSSGLSPIELYCLASFRFSLSLIFAIDSSSSIIFRGRPGFLF
jgi:hypothetical protein